MKKRLIVEIIGAILIFIIGYFIGDSAAINRVNKNINAKVSNETSQTSTSQSNTNSSKEKQKIYKLGEEGTSGNWSIKVLDANEATTIEGGDSSDNKTTQQKFIVVKIQMTNKSQTAAQYSPDDFLLGDMNTKTQYKMNMEAGGTANSKEIIYNENGEFFGVYDDINPNTPKQTYVVFEVPKDFSLQNAVLIHGNNEVATGFYLK